MLPSGNYAGAINEAMIARLKDWIRGGGTLVTLAEASRWATGENVGLLDTKLLLKNGNLDRPGDTKAPGMPSGPGANAADARPSEPATGAKPSAAPTKPGADATGPAATPAARAAADVFDYDKAIQPDRERPDAQPGAILRVIVDTEHWLSAGQDEEAQAIIEGDRVFAPLQLNSGRNVGIYAKKDRLIASGLIWPENQDLLVQKAFAMHQPTGQGHVIAFAEDANYRAFSEATMLLFMNAVLLGPGY